MEFALKRFFFASNNLIVSWVKQSIVLFTIFLFIKLARVKLIRIIGEQEQTMG